MSKKTERTAARKQAEFSESRRKFLIAVGAGGALLATGYGAWLLGLRPNPGTNDPEKGFRQGLKMPEFQIPAEKVSSLLGEGWTSPLEINFPNNFNALTADQQNDVQSEAVGKLLTFALTHMAGSVYDPFRQSFGVIDKNKSISPDSPETGAIILGHNHKPLVNGGTEALGTGFELAPNNKWYASLVVNYSLFNPMINGTVFAHYVNLAIAIDHEMAHYDFGTNYINYRLQKGDRDLAKIVSDAGRHPLHESYAWTRTAETVKPLLNIRPISAVIASAFADMAGKWYSLKKDGASWDDPRWVSVVNDYLKH